MNKTLTSLKDKHLLFGILTFAVCVFVVVANFLTISTSNYLVLEDFYNSTGENVNSFNLLIPFFLNLFVLGPFKNDVNYFNSNSLLEIAFFLPLALIILLELFGFKKRVLFGKMVLFNSFLTFKFAKVIYLVASNEDNIFFNLLSAFVLLFFVFFYSFYCLINIVCSLKQEKAIDRHFILLTSIKRILLLVLLLGLFYLLAVATNASIAFYYFRWINPPELDGFSLRLKDLLSTHISFRFPSFLLFVIVGYAVSLIALVLILKHNNILIYKDTLPKKRK